MEEYARIVQVHTLLERERNQTALQLGRTVQLSIVLLFVIVFLMFALITPLPRPQPLVELPISNVSAIRPETECDAVVSITRDGTLFYRELWVRPLLLTQMLRAHRPYPQCRELPLVLRVDRNAPFHAVRESIIAARRAGWRKVLVVARYEPRKPEQAMSRSMVDSRRE